MSSIPAPHDAPGTAPHITQDVAPATAREAEQGAAPASDPDNALSVNSISGPHIAPALAPNVAQGVVPGYAQGVALASGPGDAQGATPDHAPHPAALPVSAGAGMAAVLLVALALPVGGRAEMTGLSRWLAVAAIVFATLTVLAAVGTLLLRSSRVVPAVVTGLLLVAATALTGSAAVVVLADGPAPAAAPVEGLTVAISGAGETATLTMRAELPHVAAGDVVRAEVTVLAEGADRLVLARQLTVARGGGPVTVTLEAPAVGTYDSLQVLVESPDRRCTANLRPMISEAPVASCKARQ